MYDLAGKRVWIAGSTGMVGSAVVRRLGREGCEIVSPARRIDLREQAAVENLLSEHKPDVVVLAAARVGGILANSSSPAEFLYDNLMIEANVIDAAHRSDVDRLLFLGSSCIYPKLAPQPIREEALLTGPLEETNEWYAVAKIAGIKLVQSYRRQYGRDYIAAMPTNLYGPGDNFDLATSHVLPALIRKAHDAKRRGEREIVVWGTGTPRREFLHVDDCADALVHLLKVYSGEAHVNVGCGSDVSILELARMVCAAVGFGGNITHDLGKPDGTPRKLLSIDKLKGLGWSPTIGLEDGIARTYQWFLEQERAAHSRQVA
jgi:GDP-L-fucose synthase